MKVRCKFVCNYKDDKTGQISFSPVYTGSDENKEFFQSTPGGTISFYCVNPPAFNSFTQGEEYYIDFTPAIPRC